MSWRSSVEEYEDQRDGQGRQRLVRKLLTAKRDPTGIKGIPVRVPLDSGSGSGQESEQVIRFRSSLVPPYLRRSKSLEELLPLLILERDLDGGLHRCTECAAGSECPGIVCQEHQPA